MRAVDLEVLKNELSEYVRLVTRGEVVLVTDRDRVVTELIPPRSGRSERVDDATLAEAVRKGWITPPALRSGTPPPRRPIAPTSEILISLRADRDAR